MTPASRYLFALAERVAQPYCALPGAHAAMVTGSVAKGVADRYSDIDMSIYYAADLPDDETLAAIRRALGGSERKWTSGTRDQGGFAEAYALDGVEVQIIHSTVAAWEATMAAVQTEHQIDTPLPKALEGMLACRPLYGAETIARWQAQAADYPPALADAMVRRYLAFFPLWGLQSYLDGRDASVWYRQVMVEAVHNILGVLAGLNRVYFTPFQFKRTQRFVAQLRVAPPDLAQRIETLLHAPPAEALPVLERLVDETTALVQHAMPHIDVAAARRRIGWQQGPWASADDALPTVA